MDPDLAMIFSFILLVLTMVLPFAYFVNKRVQEHEERKLELKARVEEAKAAQVSARDGAALDVEDRLRVLERIVTDPSTDLARQIEDLRAERRENAA